MPTPRPRTSPARLGAAVLAGTLAVLVAACGNGDPGAAVTEAGAEAAVGITPVSVPSTVPPGADVEAAMSIDAPPVAQPDALPSVAPVTVPATVELHRPSLIVRGTEPGSSALYAAFGVPGVTHLAGVAEFDALLVGDDGEGHPVHVLAVDPSTFRPMTPDVTAQEPGVWQRLSEGDVVVRHDVAYNLGLTLGGSIELHGEHQVPVRIGAFASNGAPPLADLIVPWDIGSRLGAGDVNALVVALDDGTSAADAGEAVVEAIGGGEIEVRDAPVTQQARIVGKQARTTFEPFSYTDLGDGMIVIDPAWVRKWIVRVDLPGLGTTRCHATMARQLMAALAEVQEAGLYGHFKREQFAGCYMPRHIDWRPDRPLSMHAWGLAIDFNSLDNGLGRDPPDGPSHRRHLREVGLRVGWQLEPPGRDALRARPRHRDGLTGSTLHATPPSHVVRATDAHPRPRPSRPVAVEPREPVHRLGRRPPHRHG